MYSPPSSLDEEPFNNTQEEEEEEVQEEEKEDRRQQLEEALYRAGVELREDSVMCDKYLEGTASLREVVDHMCEAKYLHEYCNFPLGFQLALGVLRYNGHKFEQQRWFEVIRRSVLFVSGEDSFPNPWPWQRAPAITPNAWKRQRPEWDRWLLAME